MDGITLISNNQGLCHIVRKGRFVNGSSLDVLVAVRNFIHLGSRLLTHPLCGNLRPYQQPYRSILIQERPGDLVDLDSLSMIEEAVAVYKACGDRLIVPGDLSSEARADYAFVDAELMRESLAQYGQLHLTGELRPALLTTRSEGKEVEKVAIVEITKENCDAEFKESPTLAVLDFWGPKCGPCMALMPKYHELAENPKYEGKVKFCSVDTSKNRRVAITFKVMSQPTFLFWKDGAEVARLGGDDLTIEAITAKVDELIA